MSPRILTFGILAMPGVVFHELGHHLFCLLTGVRVYHVVYFRFGNPAGFVVHATPRRFRDHFAIVVGPFILNSIVSFLLFLSVDGKWTRSTLTATAMPTQILILTAVATWLGLSVALQAFPSTGDARGLWHVTNQHVRRGNLLAIVGYPMVALIYLMNLLRRLWLDWIYALALLILSAVAL
ncbi:MAG: metalloprotease family protein [Chloroflexi bacterium]|nr:metalloprotease family protein [Chloroflexota bacterium]MDA8186515.1 metalloprotease family protein [Dehalococcoidales bacterium]